MSPTPGDLVNAVADDCRHGRRRGVSLEELPAATWEA